MKVKQVDRSKKMYILWPVKYCTKAGMNLFSLTCELLQDIKMWNDHKNNIIVETTSGDITLDCQIKTHDGWVAGVEFLSRNTEEAHMVKSSAQLKRKK